MHGLRAFARVLALPGLVCIGGQAIAAQADWNKEWEQTLSAARKEGQVTVYIYRYEKLLADFKKEFPGINVVSVPGARQRIDDADHDRAARRKVYRRCL